MAIKVYGDKIVFPDSTEQNTAYNTAVLNNVYNKDEVDAQQKEQDDKIQANTDAIEVNADEIDEKVSEAPVDGKPYARKNKGWHEVEAGTGDVEEAPKDGKTYGRKNEAWSEVTTDSYTKAEIDTQQESQDDKIADNATDIAQNTTDIAKNTTDIAKNKTDIEALTDDIDALTGSVIYKGSLNATVTPAPADAVVGDMWINEYNVSEPATNYPLASGWNPVTEAKYDDKLIKTDAGWDKIESVVGVPSYTAGEIDALLDDKADKDDSYLKAETDALLNDKADSDLVYTKVESDAKNDEQDTAIQENKDAIASIPTAIDTYTKDEIDAQQILQNDEIEANADAIVDKADKTDVYTKAESDATNKAQDDKIQANTDSIDALPSSDDYYNKDEVDALQAIQDDVIDFKADKGDSYLKAETDTLLDNKANVGDSYTKAENNTLLDKKADKTTTYTKTEVDSSQALQNTEIAKKANQATTYTKDEVDELLENASGAIVGNYTNKQASNVARDPGVGNLYLANGMNFSTDYNDVTSIYISDTDGDGDVRDFDEVKVDDKITLTSENGSGEYTVFTISDVGGYRELVVDTESATGTIADDTAVSIVLDVASSETGGGIEEAPEDGKQYARQDGDWSEVTGSGSTPTPEDLVWEDKKSDREWDTEYTNTNEVPLYIQINSYTKGEGIVENWYFEIDGTKMGWNGTNSTAKINQTPLFIVPAGSKYKAVLGTNNGDVDLLQWHEARMPLAIAVGGASSGVEAQPPVAFNAEITIGQQYDSQTTNVLKYLSATVDTDSGLTDDSYIVPKDGLYSFSSGVYFSAPNGVKLLTGAGTSLAKNGDIVKTGYLQTLPDGTGTYTATVDQIINCVKGDVIQVKCWGRTQDSTPYRAWEDRSWFSGHMISSITEGEVKEKEAVVFKGNVNGQTVTDNVFSQIEFESSDDTTSSWNSTTNEFKPSVAGYYNVSCQVTAMGSATVGLARIGKNNFSEFFDGTNIITPTVNQASVATNIFYLDGVNDSIAFMGRNGGGTSINAYCSISLITGQSTGGGSGGGSYTPEPLVWEDLRSTREKDVVYTNDNDVPLYISIYINTSPNSYAEFHIDGQNMSTIGLNNNTGGGNLYSPLFQLIPAGSTFELKTGAGTVDYYNWKEAKMPVAVGTGGDSHWTESGNDLFYKSSNFNSGLYINSQEDNNINLVGYNGADANDLWLRSGGVPNTGLGIRTDGSIDMPQVYNGFNTSNGPNIYMSSDGKLHRSTSATYSTEEVDKKLAIKDKLIEKLSARLDELEKKLK